MAPTQLTRIGVYERTLPASEERVWENVRDWEHLPWLHCGSFSSIDLVDEGEWGWRARIGVPGGDAPFTLELVIEPDAPRYVSRTLDGAGAGTEIWTDVDARGEKETHVRVEFFVPEVPREHAERLGSIFVDLYTRLWDEDESMMVRRQEELAARRSRDSDARPVSLGALASLRGRLPLVARFGGERFRIVEHAGGLVAHAVVCPHRLGPLDAAPIADGRVVCPWHGYAFDVSTGRECSGRRMALGAAPRVEVDPESQEVRLVGAS